MQHTLATGRAATLIKLAFAAGAKLSAAFIAFGLTALVTRNMPNDEAGLFLLGFSLLAVFYLGYKLCLVISILLLILNRNFICVIFLAQYNRFWLGWNCTSRFKNIISLGCAL